MSLLLKTLNNLPRERCPVWFMRQAGRYLPDYRRVRKQAGDFLTLCQSPEMASEVTCQPVEILGVDAAIIFSDILVIPDSLGLPLELKEGQGPVFNTPLKSFNDLKDYTAKDSLSYVYEAIRLSVKRLPAEIPLIGFAGSPWTLFSYMVEGHGSKNFTEPKKFIWEKPEEAQEILEKLCQCVIEHLSLQAEAGAQVVQVFDTWGGLLDREDFMKFSWPFLKKIAEALEARGVPTIVFSKGCSGRWDLMKEIPSRALSVDWQINLSDVRKIVGPERVLQGNLDPIALCGSVETMRGKLRRILSDHGPDSPLIINLGHGVTPDADLKTVQAFIKESKDLSQELFSGVLT